MSNEALEKIIKARISLLYKDPFFAHLALMLIPKEEKNLPTIAATDGTYLYYNPDRINKLNLSQIKTTIAHESLHPAFLHHIREGYREHQCWNISADLAENQILAHEGFIFPPGVLTIDSQFQGMTAEKIYSILMNQKKDLLNKLKNQAMMGNIIFRKNQSQDSYENSSEYQKQKWKSAIKAAYSQAKACGKVPAGIEQFIDNLLDSQLEWEILLKRFIESIGKNNSQWYPANKRFIWQGLHLPSWKSETLGNIIFAVDLSGSMSDKEVQICISEAAFVIQNYYFENIWVLSFDTKVQSVDHFEDMDINPKFNLKGRGGTDIKPVFDWIDQNNIEPSCLICMTDMEFPINFQEPNYPVLWLSTTDNSGPFGETIKLKIH